MADPAYLSDELELTTVERASAAALHAVVGPAPTTEGLIERLQRYGRDVTVLETALILTLPEYRKVEEVYKRVPTPDQMAHDERRRRREAR